MIVYKGLKVIGFEEPVIGKVVELEHGAKFKIVEYYINEYNTYLNRTVDEFDITPDDDLNVLWENFKEELGKHVALKEAYIEYDVFDLLTTANK